MLALPLRGSTPEPYHGKYIAGMFGSGEQGVWYDPSDKSTLFQDAAGTIPVTAVEQPVGLMKDKSGRGNHAKQTTSTSRPVLSARYNLLTKTEDFTDTSSWQGNRTTRSSGITDPNGGLTACAIYETAATGVHWFAAIGPLPGGAFLTQTLYLKYAGRQYVQVGTWQDLSYYNVCFDLINGVAYIGTSVLNATISAYKNDWWEIKITSANVNNLMQICLHTVIQSNTESYTGDPTKGVFVWSPQVVPVNQAHLPYQRVNTATDYDADPVKFPPYLKFDGVDDYLVTNSIDFTATDKMTVFSADVSQWDNATRGIVGLSNSAFGNNGTFWLTSFDMDYSAYSMAYLRGGLNGLRGALVYGPDQRTLGLRRLIRSVRFDISKTTLAEEVSVRLNGVSQAVNAALDPSAGDGNFGNWPLYIGRIGSGNPFNGHLYGLIVRGAQTDDAHLTHAEKFLAYKSGVTL